MAKQDFAPLPIEKDEDFDPSKAPPNNPHGNEFTAMKDDGRRFRVMHTGVGNFREKAIISAKDLGPGAQLDRLLDTIHPTGPALVELHPHELREHRKAVAEGKLVEPSSLTLTSQPALDAKPDPHLVGTVAVNESKPESTFTAPPAGNPSA